MMAEVHVNQSAAHRAHCEWCGRKSAQPLVTVTVMTSRMVFHEDICEDCRKAFADHDEAA